MRALGSIKDSEVTSTTSTKLGPWLQRPSFSRLAASPPGTVRRQTERASTAMLVRIDLEIERPALGVPEIRTAGGVRRDGSSPLPGRADRRMVVPGS